MAKVRSTFDLPSEKFDQLMQYAKDHGMSRNAVIEKALDEFFKNKKDDAKV